MSVGRVSGSQRDDHHAQGADLERLALRPKLGLEVTNKIRDAIMSGGYEPGRRLVVDDVAHQLGISAMPVREALVALANEGLLDALPSRGFSVGRIARQDVKDIIELHAFVAGLLAERAALVITEIELERLEHVQLALEGVAQDGHDREHRSQIGDLNYQFHRTINKMVDADRLIWFLRAVTSYVPRNVYEDIPGWSALAVTDHPGIIEALARRDTHMARELTERHVTASGEMVIEHLATLGFWMNPEKPQAFRSRGKRTDSKAI